MCFAPTLCLYTLSSHFVPLRFVPALCPYTLSSHRTRRSGATRMARRRPPESGVLPRPLPRPRPRAPGTAGTTGTTGTAGTAGTTGTAGGWRPIPPTMPHYHPGLPSRGADAASTSRSLPAATLLPRVPILLLPSPIIRLSRMINLPPPCHPRSPALRRGCGVLFFNHNWEA